MNRKIGGIVLAASVVGGVAVGVAAGAMTGEKPSRPEAKVSAASSPTPSATPSAQPAKKPTVEVKDPMLVTNRDGSATLSATLVNHTDQSVDINNASVKDHRDASLLVYGRNAALEPGSSMRIGGVDDDYRIRLRDPFPYDSARLALEFMEHDGIDAGPTVTFRSKVVERSAAHADVANNGPNTAVTVHDAKIVVVPGQSKAYVAGWITSTIEDYAYDLPTAIDSSGGLIAYRHQTATGGPYGIGAVPGQEIQLGSPPYLDREPHGDADYFRAKEVTVGETVMVTMKFPSGDLVTPFEVVRGNADGTI